MGKLYLGASILLLIILTALLGPLLSSYSYHETDLCWKNSAPSLQFLCGTDELGRDLFVRICMGARLSLFLGTTAACIDLVIGAIFGSVAALSGKKVQTVMLRKLNILSTIPYLLLATFLTLLLGPGTGTILVALTITGWVSMARTVYAQITKLKSQEFVIAATLMGASNYHLLRYHFLPHMLDNMIITTTLTIPAAIFTEAFLSFLGLGVQAPLSSLGSMADAGILSLRYHPWHFFFPAGTISLLIFSLHLLADGLQQRREPC